MPKESFVVVGDLNFDTSVKIDDFPIDRGDTYFTIDGVLDHIGGAATNVAVGMRSLGQAVKMCSAVGKDEIGKWVIDKIGSLGVDISYIRRDWALTARTVILVDRKGSRRCLSDPKEINTYRYPSDAAEEALRGSELIYVSTQNWTRYIARQAHESGIKVAVDIHAVTGVDEYHLDYLKTAHMVFFSTERLEMPLKDFITTLWYGYDIPIVVATHGKKGATLAVRDEGVIYSQNSVSIRAVVDTNGAGDSFCAGFLAAYADGCSLQEALLKAQITAAYKIGEKGSTNGFPSKAQVDCFYNKLKSQAATELYKIKPTEIS